MDTELKRLDGRLSEIKKKLTEEIEEIKKDIQAEIQARKAKDRQHDDLIQGANADGLALEVTGALWIGLGIIFAAASEELAIVMELLFAAPR